MTSSYRYLLLATLGAALATPAAAQQAYGGYTAPRTSFGQPDLGGFWTNATLTPTTRSASLGDRLVFTEEEVDELENAHVEEFERGREDTDPDAPPPAVGGEIPEGVRPEFAAAGGGVGGYNIGWLSPGDYVMRVHGEPRTSLITTENGRVPRAKPDAPRTRFTPPPGGAFANPETRGMGERCIIGFGRNAGPPMFPNGFYNNNYHIVQSPEAISITVEMNHDVRVIRLNAEHRKDDVRPWFGDSIGWWEGDTLVVETTHMPEVLAYNGSWENLKVTERLTRVAENRLHYAFTVEDPDFWDEPWGGEYEFNTLDGQIWEYACHEGNYALEGILAGARAEEANAALEEEPVAAAP